MTALLWIRSNIWILALAALFALYPTYRIGHHYGESLGRSTEHARMVAEASVLVAAADAKYRALEASHAATVADSRVIYIKEDAKEDVKDAQNRAAYRAGARRLRLPATSCPAVPAPGTTTERANDPAPVDIAPETSAALYAIAADCDDVTRQLTALQDWARQALILCH